MSLEIKKENRESAQNLFRRFSRAIQQSGILRQARKNQFKRRKKSEGMSKRSALRKEEKRKEFEKLKKLGKLPEKHVS